MSFNFSPDRGQDYAQGARFTQGPTYSPQEAHRILEDAYEALLRGQSAEAATKLERLLFDHNGLNPIKARVREAVAA